MKREQKIVAIGAASGIVSMALLVWLLSRWLPATVALPEPGDRIAFALRVNVLALVPYFVMLISIGDSRFLSDAIDPTRKAENLAQQIDGRVADNTLQQNFVFAIASLGLATVLKPGQLQVIWACAVVFCLARVVFWIGYRLDPLFRAPGMSATAYLNLGMILYVLYQTFVGA